ncbi:MAG: proton-conducting membrane transporter [Defluviitaleaceae bacterium]|nr:proton-conducting membrane transporter [Defluviitaleaceae bacterium]
MLTYFVIAPILIAVFLYLLSSRYIAKLLAILVQAVFLGFTFFLFMQTRESTIITVVGGYEYTLGIVLRADMLSAAFVMLTSFIFLITAIYALNESWSKLYWLLIYIWQGLIIGIFLVRDFFNVFVLFEVATLIVAVLILFLRERRSVFDGLIYIMVNTVAIQFYLFGVAYVYMLTGTLNMDIAAAALAEIAATDPTQLTLPYVLIMTAIIFKCALIPLASWLPKVQGIPRAPSAVAAILSGLHVKCAVFLFLQFQLLFEPIANSDFFLILGLLTAILSIIMAFSQDDIRLILAYSSTAQIGLIVVGLSTGGANYGSLYHIINHAIFKTSLFLTSGMLMQIYKTRDINKITGVFKNSPVLGVAMLLSILAIAGAPLFNGNVSKYFIMDDIAPWLYVTLSVVNFGTIAIFVRYSLMLLGKPDNAEVVVMHKNKLVSVLLLGVISLLTGIFGVWSMNFLFDTQLALSFGSYLEKTIIFFVSVALAVLLCKYRAKMLVQLEYIRNLDLNFRGMCVSVGLFFAVMLLFVGIF